MLAKFIFYIQNEIFFTNSLSLVKVYSWNILYYAQVVRINNEKYTMHCEIKVNKKWKKANLDIHSVFSLHTYISTQLHTQQINSMHATIAT